MTGAAGATTPRLRRWGEGRIECTDNSECNNCSIDPLEASGLVRSRAVAPRPAEEMAVVPLEGISHDLPHGWPGSSTGVGGDAGGGQRASNRAAPARTQVAIPAKPHAVRPARSSSPRLLTGPLTGWCTTPGSDDTDARKEARRCFGRSHRSAQRSVPWHDPIELMEGSRKQPPNCRDPPCDRGTGQRQSCRTTRPPPKRLIRPEGTVVFARRAVLRSSFP
jgi:hypothetical protein